MTDQQTNFTKEKVMQEQIMPLIKQVHALCEENKIPFLAAFSFGYESKEYDKSREQRFHMGGSVCLHDDDSVPPEMDLAYKLIFQGISAAAPAMLADALRSLSGRVTSKTVSHDEPAAASAN